MLTCVLWDTGVFPGGEKSGPESWQDIMIISEINLAGNDMHHAKQIYTYMYRHLLTILLSTEAVDLHSKAPHQYNIV